MKTLLTLCCLMIFTATMAESIELTIDNQSKITFDTITFKGQDTTIDPDITQKGLPSGKKLVTTLTKDPKSITPTPIGTFLLNPNQQRLGISIASPSMGSDPRLIVTNCPFCEPTGTTDIKDGKASVTIYLER